MKFGSLPFRFQDLKLIRSPRSLAPTLVTLPCSLALPVLAPATLAALPSTRAIPDRDVSYVARPTHSIQRFSFQRDLCPLIVDR